MKNLIRRIENRFEFSKYGTTWKIELLAGLGTYLSLAYIFIVNPAILGNAGMNVSAVLFATVIASGLATLIMGLWARLPFALAPGLEMNSFFAFVVVGTMGLTWNEALGAVFWSGILCIILSLKFIRQRIIDSIPLGLKKSMAISVGMFVFTIGLFLAGVVQFDNGSISNVGIHFSAKEMALLIGLIISFILGLKKLNFPAGMLIAIIVATVYCKTQGIFAAEPAKISIDMFAAVFQLDIFPSSIKLIPIFFVFFLIDFYGSIGKFIGLTAATPLTDKDGNLARIDKAMYVDGIGTVGGSLLGTSSIITYVESAVGITMGGRTGIVAIVCGILMLASLFFTPLVGLVPVEATAGVLCYVGYLLILETWKEKMLAKYDFFIVGIMILITVLTFNLGQAMAFGFIAYTYLHISKSIRSKSKLNWYLIVSTIAITLSIVLQFILK